MTLRMDTAVNLLWEIRSHFEDKERASRLDRDEFDLLVQLRLVTLQTLTPRPKLQPTGEASRDRLIAARLSVRSSEQ